jgi:hypothetical protein
MLAARRPAARRWTLAAIASLAAAPALAEVTYEDVGGIRYQVTRQTVPRQVPVTEMRDQQQTVYTQQVTVDNLQQQQLYTVPVTQYQLVTRMHGRFNPFVTPYYTHHYVPVTTWTQQVATVQIPVSRVSWAPQTRTVQVPVTTYRTAQEEVVHRVAIGATPTTMAARPLPSGGTPSATLAARPSAPPASTPYVAGGVALPNDPPRQATGWQAPSDSRYR